MAFRPITGDRTRPVAILILKPVGIQGQCGYPLTQVAKPSRNYREMHIEQAKQFKELGKENLRLNKLVAELLLDNAKLRKEARGNL